VEKLLLVGFCLFPNQKLLDWPCCGSQVWLAGLHHQLLIFIFTAIFVLCSPALSGCYLAKAASWCSLVPFSTASLLSVTFESCAFPPGDVRQLWPGFAHQGGLLVLLLAALGFLPPTCGAWLLACKAMGRIPRWEGPKSRPWSGLPGMFAQQERSPKWLSPKPTLVPVWHCWKHMLFSHPGGSFQIFSTLLRVVFCLALDSEAGCPAFSTAPGREQCGGFVCDLAASCCKLPGRGKPAWRGRFGM